MLILEWTAAAWTWLNEYGAAIGSVAGFAAAIIAIAALRTSAADNRSRSQPMVTAEFRPAPDSDTTIDFVVSNAGPTPARDLKATFDPPLVMPTDTSKLVAPFIVKRYAKPIPVLNPGQMLSNTWWAGETGAGPEQTNREPTPDEVTVTVTYKSIGRRLITETYPLTIEIVTNTTWSTSSTSLKGRVNTIDTSLKNIATELKSIASKN